ncbi:MAG TPA: hypothetical protein VMG81_07615 [Thermoplasmata archaeon]|nr:hypothetical protein [Thermoplasmata archaeon]
MTGHRLSPRAPATFHVDRSVGAGSHRLEAVFPGLDRLPELARLPLPSRARGALVRTTRAEVVRGPVWMYVAPHEVPEILRRAGVSPRTAPDDRIVIGASHLRRSARMVLMMDVLHELCHVIQRRAGRDLWQEGYRYADRPTEIEAYRVVLDLARAHGASDRFLQEYLRVDWLTPKEYRLLLRNVGVPPPSRASRRRSARPDAERP